MAELKVRLDIHVSPKIFHAAFALALVSFLAGDLASEQVTLTTYYPAPSGVYTQLVATQNSYLSRDGGTTTVGSVTTGTSKLAVDGGVAVGANYYKNGAFPYVPTGEVYVEGNGTNGISIANATPKSMLDVSGNASLGTYGGVNAAPANGMIVSGTVGIGTNAPANKLQVFGLGGGNIDAAVNGRIITGDAGNSGGIWVNQAQTEFFGQNGTSASVWVSPYNNWALNVNSSGRVAIDQPAATAELEVNGMVAAHSTSCWWGTTANVSCGGNTYATVAEGFMSKYMSLGPPAKEYYLTSTGTGPTFYFLNEKDLPPLYLCCTCAAGACPSM